MTLATAKQDGIAVTASNGSRQDEILSPAALAFLADLHREFNGTRKRLLKLREERQKRFDAGELPDFLAETRHVREGDWTVAPIPADLLDRRVEITGPVDRKMIINALNSGAKVFMADFEDASSPTWDNMIEGQANLKDRWAGQDRLHRRRPRGKAYKLSRQAGRPARAPARLAPARGSRHGRRRADVGSLFDFGLYVFHNAKADRGQGLDARPSTCRRWRAISKRGSGTTSSPTPRRSSACRKGTVKATILIETLPAAFEMDEILYELRDHIAGLNCGRWDYIFSFIKRLGKNARFLTPDRSAMVMGQGLPQRLFAAADQDLPPPRRLRHGRHGGADPGEERPGRQRGRLRQGARRQGARGQRRP